MKVFVCDIIDKINTSYDLISDFSPHWRYGYGKL